jgi:hypothetical protein
MTMGEINNVSKFPTDLLSSFVDLICSQCNEQMKDAIQDDVEMVKSALSRIDGHVKSFDQGKQHNKEQLRPVHFTMPCPPVVPLHKTVAPAQRLSPLLEDHPHNFQDTSNEKVAQERNEGRESRQKVDLNNQDEMDPLFDDGFQDDNNVERNRMSVHKAPVFKDQAPIDDLRMVRI